MLGVQIKKNKKLKCEVNKHRDKIECKERKKSCFHRNRIADVPSAYLVEGNVHVYTVRVPLYQKLGGGTI